MCCNSVLHGFSVVNAGYGSAIPTQRFTEGWKLMSQNSEYTYTAPESVPDVHEANKKQRIWVYPVSSLYFTVFLCA